MRTESAADWSLAGVDAALAGLVLVAPFVFGGRHDFGRLVVVLLAGAAAILWRVHLEFVDRPRRSTSTTTLIPILAVVWVALQLVPMPASLLDWLSPRTTALLPLLNDPAFESLTSLGRWRTLSLTPADTRIALAMTIAYGLIYVTTVERLRTVEDVQRLLRTIGLASAAMACFGLVQYAWSNGKFFWVYEVAARSTDEAVCGAFTNRNHFAHFLALGVGPLASWLLSRRRRRQPDVSTNRQRPTFDARAYLQPALLALALAVVLFAGLLTLSRGGAAALTVAAAVVLLGGRATRMLQTKHLLVGIGVAASVVGLLSLYGYDDVADRLDDYGSIEKLDGAGARRMIWSANLAAFRAGWLTGAGAGGHAELYPLYMPEALPLKFTHAENGYLQIAAETGLPGLLLLVAAIVSMSICLYRALAKASDRRVVLAACAVAAGIAASLVHSLVDFVWYIPACMTTTVLLAACGVRLAQLAAPRRRPAKPAPGVAIAITLGVVVAALWSISTLVGPGQAASHWDRYRVISRARSAEVESILRTTDAGSIERSREHCEAFDRSMIAELEEVVGRHPGHARAHLRLARLYLRRFDAVQQRSDNQMSVREIREAAIASRFPSRKALHQWLDRAFGKPARLLVQADRHAWQAVMLSPLSGSAYLQLAQTCFLSGRQEGTVDALVDQAVRVRPYDGDILLAAGDHHRLRRRPERAEELWKHAFRLPGDHQLRLITMVCRQLPARVFLEMFEPDLATLFDIWRQYRAFGAPEDQTQIAQYGMRLAAEAEQNADPRAGMHWLTLARIYGQQDRPEEVVDCTARAIRLAPREFRIRRAHGLALIAVERTQEAEPHLRWCLARKPDDREVQEGLARALRLSQHAPGGTRR